MWTSVSADMWPHAPGGGCGMGKVPIFTLWTALPKPARADTAFLHLGFFEAQFFSVLIARLPQQLSQADTSDATGEASLHPCFGQLKAKKENNVGTKWCLSLPCWHTLLIDGRHLRAQAEAGLEPPDGEIFGRVQGSDSQDFPGTPCRGVFESHVYPACWAPPKPFVPPKGDFQL